MGFVPLIRPAAALAVAAHLSLVPVAASIHEATHFRFESGVALADGVEPCQDAGARPHKAHLDGARAEAGDLLCAFCQLFHKGLERQGQVSHALIAYPSTAATIVPVEEPHPLLSLSIRQPQSRSPPLSA